jgi:hypothetical protein
MQGALPLTSAARFFYGGYDERKAAVIEFLVYQCIS